MGLQELYVNFETIYALEICALLRCFAAYSGKSSRTFRDTLQMKVDRLSRNVCKYLPLYAAQYP